MKKITIPNDIETVKSIAEAAFAPTPDSSLYEWFSFEVMINHIDDDLGICLKVTDDKGSVIGMIYAEQESPINGKESLEKWVIVIAAVYPDASGTGVGTALLSEIEIQAKNKGIKKLFVYTNKGDDEIVSFYKKNGFENTG